MATQEMMSPSRSTQELLPHTPASVRTTGASSIQPSPNRTEAAAAMMHLLTGDSSSNDQDDRACQDVKSTKAKRKYVRRAPMVLVNGDKESKIPKKTRMISGGSVTGKPPLQEDAGRAVKHSEEEDQDSKNEDCTMDGDEVRFFPYREYNRKEKSLGLLCEKFLNLYRDDKISEISLNQAATELGVGRRRIYDIVNILESIHLVSRKSKNRYNWHGLDSLPGSISVMKQRYLEAQKPPSSCSSSTKFPPIKSDRRRGKSLSKLSQAFVQLFFGKENFIPLELAAGQLILMEDSENPADSLLKTKIRRLYDVANVLVGVGLIEKVQFSLSRKPVFRWKLRASNSIDASESASKVGEIEGKSTQADSNSGAQAISEDVSSRADVEDTNVMNSPQSCDSDVFDDESDFQSGTSSYGGKRKQNSQESDASMSDGESPAKRSRLRQTQQPSSGNKPGLLRMGADNEPIHPQVIFTEQQEQVKLYMQQYVREYGDYLVTHKKKSEGSIDADTTTLCAPKPRTTAKKNHGTPISLPPLAGSLQDLLLLESPQSVSDIVDARVLSNLRPPLDSSPAAAKAIPRPLILRNSGTKRTSAGAKVSSTLLATAKSTTKEEEESYDAPRNLIMALQPRSQS